MIYDQFGRPYKKSVKPSTRSIAAAPIVSSDRDYVADGLTPVYLADYFKLADSGDVSAQAELFDQMEERDAHLIGEVGKRKNVMASVEFQLEPASEDARDVKVAEFCQDWIDGQNDWTESKIAMQDAVGKGYAALSINWDVSEGQALPISLDFLEQKRFLFYDKTGYVNRFPLLITDENMMGEVIQPWSMLLHVYGGKSGHPTKSAIFRPCAWLYLFKNYSLKDWVVFASVYGQPLRLGKYSPGASDDDKDALYTALVSLGSDAAGIISESTAIEFVSANAGRTSSDIYANLAKFCDKGISKAVIGQTLSAEVGDKGSYAAANTHNEIRKDLVESDAMAQAATVRTQLLQPIVGFNFGWETAVPKYWAPFEEPEDLKAKADWVKILLDAGVQIPDEWGREQFDLPDMEEGAKIFGGLKPAEPKKEEPETESENEEKEVAKLVVSKEIPKKIKQQDQSLGETLEMIKEAAVDRVGMDELIKPIRAGIMKAKSYKSLKMALGAYEKQMPSEAFVEMMNTVLLAGEMAGRAQDA